jgi:TonB family protein
MAGSPSMSPVGVGSVIGGRFELLARLGAGGQSSVFKARDRQLDIDVAIKVLRLDGDPQALRRFHSEVRLARIVKHPNVGAIHEYGEDGDVVYCAMELVEGRNLRELLSEHPLAWDRAYPIAIELAQALEAIHGAGVIHRDVKSANVMIDLENRARLVDFGIAKPRPGAVQDGGEADVELTEQRHVVGTPEYMSPEQVCGAPLDARSDIYSLGIVLYELFTGRVPFRAPTRWEVMNQQVGSPPPFGADVLSMLPEPLVPVLRKALAKVPAERYASAAELGRALRAAQQQLSPTTETRTQTRPPITWLLGPMAARIADRLTQGALFALALLAAVALVLLFLRRAPAADPLLVPRTAAASVPASPSASTPSPPLPATPGPVATPDSGAGPRGSAAPERASRPRAFRAAPPPPAVASAEVASPAVVTTTTTLPTTTTTTTTPVPEAAAAPPQQPTPTPVHKRPPTRGDWLDENDPDVVLSECGQQPVRYSAQAESLGVHGHVLVEMVIDEDGRVTEPRVLRSPDPVLTRLALDNLKRWNCRPATRLGVPGKIRTKIGIDFVLPRR